MPATHPTPLSPLPALPVPILLKLRQNMLALAHMGGGGLVRLHTTWMRWCDERNQRAMLQGLPDAALHDLGAPAADAGQARHSHKIIL